MPIKVTYNVNIKCNECPFNQTITTSKRKERIEKEIYNCVRTTQKGLHQATEEETNCSCILCKHRWKAKYIEDSRGTRYKLSTATCQTRNAIYVIHCSRCQKNYIGMTLNLKQRFSQHMSSIRNRKDTSISDHFNSPLHDPNDLKIALLDRNISNRLDLRLREGYWIHLLQTTFRGLNKKEESTMIDFQILPIVQHYRHSKTCFPFMTFSIEKLETLNLQTFRRVLLPRRRHRIKLQ